MSAPGEQPGWRKCPKPTQRKGGRTLIEDPQREVSPPGPFEKRLSGRESTTNKGSTDRQGQGLVRNCVQPSCGQLSPEQPGLADLEHTGRSALTSRAFWALPRLLLPQKGNQYWVSQGTELGRKLSFLTSHMHSAPYTNILLLLLLLLFETLTPQANQQLTFTLFRKGWALRINFFSSAVAFSSRESGHPSCVGSYHIRSELYCRFHGPVSLSILKAYLQCKGVTYHRCTYPSNRIQSFWLDFLNFLGTIWLETELNWVVLNPEFLVE